MILFTNTSVIKNPGIQRRPFCVQYFDGPDALTNQSFLITIFFSSYDKILISRKRTAQDCKLDWNICRLFSTILAEAELVSPMCSYVQTAKCFPQ